MADQDEFDPIGRDWRRAYEQCVGGEQDTDTVGESLLRALTRMLQHSGGCTVFDDLEAALERLVTAVPSADGEPARRQVYAEFAAELDRVARKPGTIDHRLDVVAIRTARGLGTQLLNGSYTPGVPGALRNHLGMQIAQNMLCHRTLDAARAHAVGLSFTSHASAHVYHDHLIEALHDHIARIGRQLALDPTGGRVRHLRLVPSQTTAAMLWDDTWRLDTDDPQGATDDENPEVGLGGGSDVDDGESAEPIDLFDGLHEVGDDEADDVVEDKTGPADEA